MFALKQNADVKYKIDVDPQILFYFFNSYFRLTLLKPLAHCHLSSLFFFFLLGPEITQ